MSTSSEWLGAKEDFDFLVIGSGAAAMSAAIRAHDLGAKVLMVEKSSFYGGSTAMSGGVCWVPDNPSMKRAGIKDSRAEGLRYLKEITDGVVRDDRLEAYVEGSHRFLTYCEEHTHVRFDALEKYTDYYPELESGKPGGRSMESRPFDGAKLKEDIKALREPHPQSQILGKFGIPARMAHTLLVNNLKSKLLMLWLFLCYALRFRKRKRAGRDTKLYCGNALIGRLRRSILDRKIPLWLNAEVVDLVRDGDKVTGAVVRRGEEERAILATRGVMLAAGGFERNQDMRSKWQRTPISTEWASGNPANMGKGIELGVKMGGALDLMREAWWTPVTLVPKSPFSWVLVVEKNLPGSIFVNQKAQRFTNEAAPYVDVGVAMFEDHAKTGGSIPSYMLFDASYRYKYPVGPIAPGYAMPDKRIPRRYRDGFMVKSQSINDLAKELELDPEALTATITRFNEMAKEGKDHDFGRGESHADRYYGDPRVEPNPCLLPIQKPPFYAIRVYPGDLGTKGGLKTDPQARVLREDGSIIEGLFAAGNCSASVMGNTYPGAGGTIGPALVFGFLGAESACS